MTALLASMTGFARSAGSSDGVAWAWELRSVNGRGLDLRVRLPPGFDALEPALRETAGRALKRGNVTANLTVKREEAARLAPDPAALEQVLALATALALPGVLRPAVADEGAVTDAQLAPVRAGFAAALDDLVAARRAEGTRLASVLATLLGEIAALRDRAAAEAADQPAAHRARMMETLAELLGEGSSLPEERIAQEVALLAARSDVREELDRLASHLDAARALLAEGAQVGRRLDFLVQEFNREANTLCSKSSSVALTATGLALKSAIEQLREQVQNIE